jgi:8-oxo-dGTP pyrophosphatase MutT (NUDIX family)
MNKKAEAKSEAKVKLPIVIETHHSPVLSTYDCEKKCCKIQVIEGQPRKKSPRYKKNKKAGFFVYNKSEDRVLLVQSKGRLWGMPKGTLEHGETYFECAVRELKEETGLNILRNNESVNEGENEENQNNLETPVSSSGSPSDSPIPHIIIQNRAVYYYTECENAQLIQDTSLQHTLNNDANGITWIKIDCLKNCINTGVIIINRHTKIAFKKFLGIYLPKTDFVVVKKIKRN